MSEAPTNDQQGVPVPDSVTRSRQKYMIWTLAVLIFLFWDDVLSITLHVLHILLEYLELVTEELLIQLFHLEEHDGQMYTAWLGLIAFVTISTWLYITIRRKIRAKFRSWAYFRSWVKIHAREHWISLTAITVFYVMYLFFL
ncbi:MAG: hypothetical protein RLZZ627_1752 [Pseudomonadota bacterium]|jgi:hypothetical protein